MLQVQVGKTESTDSAMRRLGRKMADAGIVTITKRRRYHESRQDRVKKRKKAAVRKYRRRQGLKV